MEFRSQEDDVVAVGVSSAYSKPLSAAASRNGGETLDTASPTATPTSGARYQECLRNHAAALGGHVVDGCGEFMPSADSDPLHCAACGCHRSFHRKEIPSNAIVPAAPSRRPSGGTPPALLLPPPHPYKVTSAPSPPFGYFAGGVTSGSGGTTTESSSEERHVGDGYFNRMNALASDAGVAPPRKRHRTKFTAEQKAQMLAFAERVGWRLPRAGEAEVEQFCAHVGVRRQVLKVWMHNNKNCGGGGSGKKQLAPQLLLPQQSQHQQHQQPPL